MKTKVQGTTMSTPTITIDLPIIAEAERAHTAATAAADGAQSRLRDAHARFAEATTAVATARAAATAPALRMREYHYLLTERILVDDDPDVRAAQAEDETARRRLRDALSTLRRAEQARDLEHAGVARLQDQAEQARRRHWALAHDPALAAELAEAVAGHEGATLYNEHERWARAARQRRAQTLLANAMAAAPAAEGGA